MYFHFIIADQHHDIWINLPQDQAEGFHAALVGLVPLLQHLRLDLVQDAGAGLRQHLVIGHHLAVEMVEGVDVPVIVFGACDPGVGFHQEGRAVGGADAHDNLGHDL
ncbi:hypothetical protein N825_21905 [Skermanella stibiiresistens SB22]|uniref:Uncharacterized protein n=1 Tax=Skermanella stibiiresistens SB22 TaxID=1385369 RepID=W9GTL6_9PROT|nr:hypothetical protein N825_21905 [Skermanella stibiiresistens SB22]